MTDRKKSLSLDDHETMRRCLAMAYTVGVTDFEQGRRSARTGEKILELVCLELTQRGFEAPVVHRSSHLRYLKSAYQAAKFNAEMAALRGAVPTAQGYVGQ